MTTHTDRRGREWRGNAGPEAVEDFCRFEDRDALGAAIRAHLGNQHGASSALARACNVTPACISDVIHGNKGVSAQLLARIADALNVPRPLRDVWHALAGHVAPDLAAMLIANPARWDAVRAMLAGEKP